MKNNNSGFTLIEMTVVILIMSIFYALAMPKVEKFLNRAKTVSIEMELRNIVTAIYMYEAVEGKLPNSLNQLHPSYISKKMNPLYSYDKQNKQICHKKLTSLCMEY